jgi:hypothetical protein
MPDVKFSVSAWSAAPPAAVFGLIRDGSTWPSWTPIGSFALEREAPDGGEGVGAIRRFKTGLVGSREEITDLVPDRRLEYRQLTGVPIRDHVASVELEPVRGGTNIVWNESFRTRVPGLTTFLKWFIRRCANRLAAAAAKRATDVPPPPSSDVRAG